MYKAASIKSNKGDLTPVADYKTKLHEFVVSHSHAKHAETDNGPYMVGALARYKCNHDQLHPAAQDVAAALGLTPDCVNPYAISVAQVVESVHSPRGCHREHRMGARHQARVRGVRHQAAGRPRRRHH